MILLHAPTILNVIQAEIVALPDIVGSLNFMENFAHFQVNKVSCVLMSLFAVTNPLLNLMLSRDLSKPLKYGQTLRKESSIVSQQNLGKK